MERPIHSGYEHEASAEMDVLITLENRLDEIDALWREFQPRSPNIQALSARLCVAYDRLQEACGFDPSGTLSVHDGNAILDDALCQTILEQAGDQVKADELIERIAHEIASYRQHLGKMLESKK
jgi:hypothetical protein